MTAEAKTAPGTRLPAAALRRGSALALTAGLAGSALFAGPAAFAEEREPNPVPHFVGAEEENDFWSPSINKIALGSSAGGTQRSPHINSSIEGKAVFGGQEVSYEILASTEGASEMEQPIVGFAIEDRVPDYLEIDPHSVEIHDPQLIEDGGRSSVVSSSQYEVSFEDGVFRIEFTQAWIDSRLDVADRSLQITFDATVAEDVAEYTSVTNQADIVVETPEPIFDEDGEFTGDYEYRNDPLEYRLPAESSTFVVPGAEPAIAVHDTKGKSVGDRVAVFGDQVQFRAHLDATFAESEETTDWNDEPTGHFLPKDVELAYGIDRFGLVENFDQNLLSIDASSVKVYSRTYTEVEDGGSNRDAGHVNSHLSDVTDDFEVSINVRDGVLQVLAVDPDEAANAEVDYEVRYNATVRNVAEDSVATSEAVQVVGDHEFEMDDVDSLSIAAVFPEKSVVEIVTDEDGEEVEIVDLDEVPTRGEFTYRIGSSAVPANPLYTVDNWLLQDEYTSGDRSLHDRWSVRATEPIAGEDGEALFEPGDIIADAENSEYFKVAPQGDRFEVIAEPAFLELISEDSANRHGWAVFVDAYRTASEGERVSNTAYEHRNNVTRWISLTTETGAERLATASPEAPEREGNTLRIPEVEGVTYHVNPEVTGEFEIPVDGIRVWAEAADGYQLPEDVETEWTFDYEFTSVSTTAPEREGNTVTIPEVEGVVYSVGGSAVLAGAEVNIPVGETLEVSAAADEAAGFELAEGVDTEWSFDYQAVEVSAEAPSFDEDTGAVTIPSVTGVLYTVDGSVYSGEVSLTLEEGETIEVVASADEGYVLTDGETTWSFTRAAADPEDPADEDDDEVVDPDEDEVVDPDDDEAPRDEDDEDDPTDDEGNDPGTNEDDDAVDPDEDDTTDPGTNDETDNGDDNTGGTGDDDDAEETPSPTPNPGVEGDVEIIGGGDGGDDDWRSPDNGDDNSGNGSNNGIRPIGNDGGAGGDDEIIGGGGLQDPPLDDELAEQLEFPENEHTTWLDDHEVIGEDGTLNTWEAGEELEDRGGLARTGAENPWLVVGGGAVLLALGGGVIWFARRKLGVTSAE